MSAAFRSPAPSAFSHLTMSLSAGSHMFLYPLCFPSHAGLLLRWPPCRAPAGCPLGSGSVWRLLLVFGSSPSLLYGCYFWLFSSSRPRTVGCRPPLCPGLDLPPDASLSAFLPNWRLVASLCRYCSYSPFSAALSGRPVWLSVHSPSCMLTSRLIHLSKGPGR